jgi:hypothetical protein
MKFGDATEYGEVLFYFWHETARRTGRIDEVIPKEYKAMVSFYSCPDPTLLRESFHTLWACSLPGNDIRVVSVMNIVSVVSMQPLPKVEGDPDGLWFVVEKSGLDDMDSLGEPDLDDEEDIEYVD